MKKSAFKKSIVEIRRKLNLVETMKQSEIAWQKIDQELYQITVDVDNLRTENDTISQE